MRGHDGGSAVGRRSGDQPNESVPTKRSTSIKPGRDVCESGRGEIEALKQVAVRCVEAQLLNHADDRADQLEAMLAGIDVTDERSIELYDVDWEAEQMRSRRIVSAKIVEVRKDDECLTPPPTAS